MNPKPDVHAYVLGDLPESERRAVEQYLAANPDAAAEAERLKLAAFALERLPEEEPPRRIAFVSDKVFEPAWWQRFWNWGAVASAAMLSAAIFSHAMLTRPQPATVTPVAAGLSSAEVKQIVEAEVGKRIEQVKLEQQAETARVLSTATRKFQSDRAAMEEAIVVLQKQFNNYYVAANRGGQ